MHTSSSALQAAAVTLGSLLRRPSAFAPLIMSFLGLALIAAVLLGVVRVTPTGDEGTPARVFQMLIALQVPIVGFFAFRWLPRAPRPALAVLLLQGAAAIVAVGTIVWLEW